MTQDKIAIDIVLLLPPEIIEKCIFVNSKLDNSEYVSFTDGYNPHITLGMGCISADKIENLKKEIKSISDITKSLTLAIPDFTGKTFFSFKISENKQLTDLHNLVMEILEKNASYGETIPEMFYESEKVKDDLGLVQWVNNFNIEHARNLYDPHITLGKGERPQFDFPLEFTSSSVGIFHIGQRGTCKKELARFNLK